MFSGPDFLYASAFFPNAPVYILCGTEPIGSIPDITAIPPAELEFSLTNLRNSVESSLDWSFFITKNMKADLNRSRLSGTLPILYIFLARTNCHIESVIPVHLDAEGNFTDETKKTTPGVRIVFSSDQGAATQTLYYFTTDLSDWGIKENPGFLKFCEQQGRGISLLKAASYLMHRNSFDTVRAFLLRNSDLILQDDSGIPFRFFPARDWTLQLYGHYGGPINIFKEFPQPDLLKAYADARPPQLDFSFGYQWHPSRSSLLVATPRELPGAAAGQCRRAQGMINVEVLFTPAEFAALPERDLTNTACVVFDVLRATSTMVTALAHGALAIFPTERIEDALALKRRQPDLLLAGERHGLRITAEDGTVFDFGNSPREFCTDRISGRSVAMTTTNGTRALLACGGANVVLIASFLNLAATAGKLTSIPCHRLLLVCGGTFEEAAYEDVVCAGAMIDALVEKPSLADSALLAWKAWRTRGR